MGGNAATQTYADSVGTGLVNTYNLDGLSTLAYRSTVDTAHIVNNAISFAKLGSTVVEGGYIRTTLIDADSVIANAAFIGGWSIASGSLSSSNVQLISGTDSRIDLRNVAGITAQGTSGTSVRFWAGSSYSNRANASFRVTHNGSFYSGSGSNNYID